MAAPKTAQVQVAQIVAVANTTNKIVTDHNKLFSGFKKHLVDDQLIDHIYEGREVIFDKVTF